MNLINLVLQNWGFIIGILGGAFGIYQGRALNKIKDDKFRLEVTQESYTEKKAEIQILKANAVTNEAAILEIGTELDKTLEENNRLNQLTEDQARRIANQNLELERVRKDLEVCTAQRETLTIDLELEKKNVRIAEKERDLSTALYTGLKEGLKMVHIHVNYKGQISDTIEGNLGS